MMFSALRQRPRRRVFAITALACAVSIAVSACGSSTPKLTPAQQITRTEAASSHIKSGRLHLVFALKLNGPKVLKGKPLALTVSGPFENKVGTDLAITVSAVGSTGDLGVDVVNKRLYVGLANTFYSVPDSALKSLLSVSDLTQTQGLSGSTSASAAERELKSLGINPRGWISAWQDLGEVNIAGVNTEHLQGQINVSKILSQVLNAVSKSTSNATAPSKQSLALIDSAITTSRVDLYIGESDHILRKADFDLAFVVPALVQSQAGGLTSGSLTASLVLTDVNQPQSVSAPANPQPLSRIRTGLIALEAQLAPALKLLSGAITSSPSSPTKPKPANTTPGY